jgi:hypothetical protein
VLFEATMADVRKREKRRRQANDAALRKNPQARLASPIVYILDELPIHIRRKATSGPRVQSSQYNLLVVVELLWKPGRKGQALPDREARLRLVRAYPRANEEAWRLVLAELGTRPDFVVADCADAITNAVRNQYQGTVGLIPSFFHVARNLRESLLKLPGATTTLDKRVVLIPELAKHLEQLSRDEALNLTARDWSRWWDELLAMVDALSEPRTGIAAQRTVYEKRIAAALPLLRAQPQLPASNAAVETRIRLTLDPFLEGRKFRYRNLARTNFLLDLAVCRSQGLFADPDRISRLIRDHNMAHRGWSLAPRTLADAQLPPPPSAFSSSPGGEDDTDPFSGGSSASTTARGQAYSSLLNPFIVSTLYAKRVAS